MAEPTLYIKDLFFPSAFYMESVGRFVSSSALLTEVISPKYTLYGIDGEMTDGNVDGDNNHGFYTFFKTTYGNKERSYILYFLKILDGLELVFTSTEETGSTDPKDYTSLNLTNFRNSIGVFDKIFYVVLDLLKKHEFRVPIYFSAGTPRLVKTYQMLTKNETFLTGLNKVGYSFKKKIIRNKITYYKFEKN